MEWTKDQYNKQYEKWVPWLEDLYLRYFTNDNKTSYATRGQFAHPFPFLPFPLPPNLILNRAPRLTHLILFCIDTLDKTKVTGVKQVDTLQDGVHNLVAGQVGQGGLAQPIGDLASREGVNRAERSGRDDKGGYIPEAAGPVAQGGNTVIGGLAQGGRQAAGAAQNGLKNVGGVLGFGGQKK